MRLILLDILWFLTPIWVGTWIAHRFGRVWLKSVDHETHKTIAYYWLKVGPEFGVDGDE